MLVIFAVCIAIAYALTEWCRETPLTGDSWFDVYPHLKPGSKKARGRGDVNREGLSRREQAHQR